MQVLSRLPSGWPALVLNADYRPLSYYPLSLWPWQETIKAVFLGRVDVVSTYDKLIHSPSFQMPLPSVVSLKQYVTQDRPPAFTRFNVFLRDSFSLPVLRLGRRADLRPCDATLPRRAHHLGEHRHRLRPLQSRQGRAHAARGAHASAPRPAPPVDVRAAGTRPQIPPQPPPRKLARLPLLGHRAGGLRPQRERLQVTPGAWRRGPWRGRRLRGSSGAPRPSRRAPARGSPVRGSCSWSGRRGRRGGSPWRPAPG